MRTVASTVVVLVALALLALGSRLWLTGIGMRLLTFQIECNGQVVFQALQGVPDSTPVPEMWNLLGNMHFTAQSNPPVDAIDGDVVVKILHVQHLLSSATIDSLRLLRNADSSWSLTTDQVVRIQEAAIK